MLYSLFERIPPVWIALFIGGVAAWVYMSVTRKHDGITDAVRERVSGVVLVYIFFSKFVAGFVFHPSFNLRNDIFSILGESPTNGWPVGMFATILYLLYGLRKANVLGRRAFAVVGEGSVSGSILLFAYLAFVNLNPFRVEDILRSVGAILLLLFVLYNRHQAESHPQRLWAVLGGVLFMTSVLVPHLTVWFFFSRSQWMFIMLIVVSLIVEAFRDIGRTKNSTEKDFPVYS